MVSSKLQISIKSSALAALYLESENDSIDLRAKKYESVSKSVKNVASEASSFCYESKKSLNSPNSPIFLLKLTNFRNSPFFAKFTKFAN